MKIEYWGDFTCPYSYIGSSNLKQALKNLGLYDQAEMKMNAYELNPDMPAGVWESTLQQLMEKDDMTKPEAEAQIQAVDNYGKESGLPINFGGEHFCNTRAAHRLTSYAQTIDMHLGMKLVSALFHANFAEGKTLSDPDVLLEIADSVGLPKEEAAKVLANDLFLEEVLEQEKQAEEIPIETIPYFVIEDTVVDSSKPVKDFEEILKKIIAEKA